MTSQQPGRLPASVYRRRRIVVGLAVLAVIVVIVLLIVRPGAGADDAKKPGASDSPEPGSSETTKADASAACDPAVIVLTPVTDKESYQAGETPMISMTVKNSGAAACTIDVDATKQYYEIVSGSDPIWNSRDCQTDAPKAFPQVLQPGVDLALPAIAWDRTRSSADTCAADRPQVTAGGATYRLTVSLGDVTSAGDVAFLLF
jgi:hypothetical protein